MQDPSAMKVFADIKILIAASGALLVLAVFGLISDWAANKTGVAF